MEPISRAQVTELLQAWNQGDRTTEEKLWPIYAELKNMTQWRMRKERMCARMMRQILVDHARARNYQKRGGGARSGGADEIAEVADSKKALVLQVSAPTVVRDWGFARAWLSSYMRGELPRRGLSVTPSSLYMG
jgi:hypothetical protein